MSTTEATAVCSNCKHLVVCEDAANEIENLRGLFARLHAETHALFYTEGWQRMWEQRNMPMPTDTGPALLVTDNEMRVVSRAMTTHKVGSKGAPMKDQSMKRVTDGAAIVIAVCVVALVVVLTIAAAKALL